MDDMSLSTFGELLKAFRKQRKITQQVLATQIGVHRNTIGAWENGEFLPDSKAIVLELARLLYLDTHNTRRLLEASLTALSPYWQVPYQRNPFFTGRDSVLHHLHNTLAHEHSAIISQSYALSGLGGIGKTQTAIEYAYRYANDYAGVFWISAETNESIVSSFVAIAELLNLPEKQDKEQDRVMAAVTRWLTTHSDWLLIFDNVEDLELVKGVLPPARCGSLLFTSRRRALGFSAHTLNLEQMTPEEGMRFLLHRARLLDPTASPDSLASEDAAIAREIVTALDGLPLAIDQAGAYIEATQCSLSDYLQLFQSSQLRLLDERDAHADHPSSVARTFALAFEQLERSNPAAAELLTVCAFLAPEAIPETFFIEGAIYLGPTFERLAVDPLEFHTTIKALLTYSLLQRNAANRTMTIHRLVQVILKERLTEVTQRMWLQHVLHAMNQLFPSKREQNDYWQVCEWLLPHALICIALSDHFIEDEALYITLMNHIATYLTYRVRFTEAELLYQRVLIIGKRILGSEHLFVAEVLTKLATLYREQGRYDQAEPLYQQVLAIGERVLGHQIATSLHGLAILYFVQGKYEEAESLYLRALRISEQALGHEHPQIAYPLYGLAGVYFEQSKYEEAESLYLRALHIFEQTLGHEHPQTGNLLTSLANIYFEQNKYEETESLYLRALRIFEQMLGHEHLEVTEPLIGLANLYTKQSKYQQAESLYQRALTLRQQHLGPQHPNVAETLHHLAHLHQLQQHTTEALSLYQQALTIRAIALGPHHPKTNATRTAYTNLLRELGRVGEVQAIEDQVLETAIES